MDRGNGFFFAFYILHMHSMHPTYNNNNNKYIKQHKFACRVQRTDDWLVGSFGRFRYDVQLDYLLPQQIEKTKRKKTTNYRSDTSLLLL